MWISYFIYPNLNTISNKVQSRPISVMSDLEVCIEDCIHVGGVDVNGSPRSTDDPETMNPSDATDYHEMMTIPKDVVAVLH